MMIGIDFTRKDILIIKDVLQMNRKAYEDMMDNEYDLAIIEAVTDRVSEIESLLQKINEWLG